MKVFRIPIVIVAALVVGLSLLTPAPHARAATTRTWVGTGGNDLWSNARNWSPTGAPVTGDSVTFRSGSDTTSTQDIAGLEVAVLTFNSSGNAINLSQKLGIAYKGAGGIVDSAGGNSISGAGGLALGGSTAFVISDGLVSPDLRIAVPISGVAGASLTKSGPGQLEFNMASSNSYSGTTRVADGTLVLNSSTSDAGIVGPVEVGDGAGSAFSSELRVTRSSEIANTSVVTVRGDGIFKLSTGGVTEDVQALILSGGRASMDTGASLILGPMVAGLAAEPASTTSTIGGAGNLVLKPGSTGFAVADGPASPDLEITVPIAQVAPGASIMKYGPGWLRFAMSAANSYDGGTTVADGVLELATSTVNGAIPAGGPGVRVGDDVGAKGSAMLLVNASDEIGDFVNVTVRRDGRLRTVNNRHEVVNSLNLGGSAGGGDVDLSSSGDTLALLAGAQGFAVRAEASPTSSVIHGPGSLVLPFWAGGVGFTALDGTAAQDLVVSARITQAAPLTGLRKLGPGKMVLSANNTYTGTTAVQEGTLRIQGVQGSSPVSLTGGTLESDADATVGALTATGGTVSPNGTAGRGTLRTGNLSLNASTTYRVQINGATAGTGFDRIVVTGTVNLGGSILNPSLGFTPSGQTFRIIDNNGTDAVVGTFAGHPNNSTFTIGTRTFRIRYNGGTGNDVVLIHVP